MNEELFNMFTKLICPLVVVADNNMEYNTIKIKIKIKIYNQENNNVSYFNIHKSYQKNRNTTKKFW